MSEKIVETRYGKHSRFDVVKKSGVFSTKYYLRKDGKPFRGSYSSLRAAVEAAEKECGSG